MLSIRSLASLATLLVASTTVLAQTFTNCNPLNSTCPNDPALSMSYMWNMTNGTTLSITDNVWNLTGPGVAYQNNTATFTMNKQGDAPTIQSNFYLFWGSTSVVMKPSPGQGIVSSIVLMSNDLDEIDS